MVTRRKIGLIYQYNENWIGGTYYLQNLIAAINLLPDNKKPQLIIFTPEEKHFLELENVTGYPYLFLRHFTKSLNFFQRLINKISRNVIKKNLINVYHNDLDVVFPTVLEELFKPSQTFLYWIPDFQEHYLPHFFNKEEILERKKYQEDLLQRAKYIVFSSESVKRDFNSIYNNNKLMQFVLHFAVTHPPAFENDVRKKYNLPNKFFICSNQFWKHKNHIVIIDAIAKLQAEGTFVSVVFTGQEYDHRNPCYFDELKEIVNKHNIAESLFFLGFISREDQLSLMKAALCVIQPSLFEGWSTVIEDGKSLNTNIIASDISVHQEQLCNYKNKQFFSPSDTDTLISCIRNIISKKAETLFYDYNRDIIAFGNNFLKVINEISPA